MRVTLAHSSVWQMKGKLEGRLGYPFSSTALILHCAEAYLISSIFLAPPPSRSGVGEVSHLSSHAKFTGRKTSISRANMLIKPQQKSEAPIPKP